jgi:hypothetical protein
MQVRIADALQRVMRRHWSSKVKKEDNYAGSEEPLSVNLKKNYAVQWGTISHNNQGEGATLVSGAVQLPLSIRLRPAT